MNVEVLSEVVEVVIEEEVAIEEEASEAAATEAEVAIVKISNEIVKHTRTKMIIIQPKSPTYTKAVKHTVTMTSHKTHLVAALEEVVDSVVTQEGVVADAVTTAVADNSINVTRP